MACLLIFLKDFIYLFLERRKGKGEREGEKHHCVVASHMGPTGDLNPNPGMCSDWELNQWPFGLQPTLNPQSYTSQGSFLIFLMVGFKSRSYPMKGHSERHHTSWFPTIL